MWPRSRRLSRTVCACGSSGSCSTSATRRPSRFLQLALVERGGAGDDGEQRGLAGAVPADEADALARLHRERSAVEQRKFTERQFGVSDS